MPRRRKVLLVAQSPRLLVRDGEMRVMSVNSSMRMASMVVESVTLTATGTSWMLSARLVAVTTISSRLASWADAPGAGASPTAASASAAAINEKPLDTLFILPSLGSNGMIWCIVNTP